MNVRAIRSRAVTIPLDHPIVTARGTVRSSPVVLIDLQSDEGAAGHAYVFCYTPAVLRPLAELVTNLAELLRGGAADAARISATLTGEVGLLGTKGLIGMALAGIDMAAWDLGARAEGISLSTMLGATWTTVPAYKGLRSMDPIQAAREAETAALAGFRAVKLKLGLPTLKADLALVRAVRASVGPGVDIMADYNQSLDLAEAGRRGRALKRESVAWMEEPLDADDDAGHAALARELEMPIQIGENWWGPGELARSISSHSMDYGTFDAARIGGVSAWLAATTLAQDVSLPISSHRYPEISASLLAATPTAHWLEYVDTVSPILARPLQVEAGLALVPDGPGSGIEWNEEAVARYEVR